jgi:hypothetical protein
MAFLSLNAVLVMLRRLGGRHRRIALDRDRSALAIGQNIGASLAFRTRLGLCYVATPAMKSAA